MGRAHLETRITENLRSSVRGLRVQIGKNNMSSGTDASGDGLADRSRSEDYDNIAHGFSFPERVIGVTPNRASDPGACPT